MRSTPLKVLGASNCLNGYCRLVITLMRAQIPGAVNVANDGAALRAPN